MFVKNRTSFHPVLAKGNVSDSLSVGAISIEHAYRFLLDGRLELCNEHPAAQPTDPPDILHQPLWVGTSVTVTGTVHGPSMAPFLRPVSLHVGSESRRLVVFGERKWQPTIFGELEASVPARFEALPLSFARAFGGSFELSPGVDARNGLPHPGGRVSYPLNGEGLGFYRDKASARLAPLPNIELAGQLITRWDDRPVPGGFAPCPKLVGLRLRTPALMSLLQQASPTTKDEHAAFSAMAAMNVLHHAPGPLILGSLAAGTPIHLEGLGRRSFRFEVSLPEASVHLRQGRKRTSVPWALRSLHIDADQETVRCVFAHAFRYDPANTPSWIEVVR